jgi:hypothetical protein
MIERFAQVAEQVATRASRREFLGRLGKAAMGVAGVVGALLLSPGSMQASHRGKMCWYTCPDGTKFDLFFCDKGCPGEYNGCKKTSEGQINCF